MPRSYGNLGPLSDQFKTSKPYSSDTDVFEAGTSSKLDTDVFKAASISGGDVKAVASNSLTNSATVLVACPDSRGVKKQVLLLGAADGGGLGGWSGPGWSAARAVVESEAGPMI